MFGKKASAWLLMLAALAVMAPLAGCSDTAKTFGKLDANGDGVLTQAELDINNDRFITPDEIKSRGKTYARGVNTFFAHGDSKDDMELTEREFAKALQGESRPPWQIALIVALVIGVPVPIGFQLGKMLRMPDHGWKIALVLFTITAGVTTIVLGEVKKGIDLSGGVILIYEIDEEATAAQMATEAKTSGDDGTEDDDEDLNLRPVDQIKADDLVVQLRKRINPGGVKEIVVRKYGQRQVEIIIPEVDAAEIEQIKRIIEKTGQLEFLIVATPAKHQSLIDKATAEERLASPNRLIYDNEGNIIGRWVPVGVEQPKRGKKQDYHGVGFGDVLRARTGEGKGFELVPNPAGQTLADLNAERINFKEAVERMGYRDLQALMWVDPRADRNVKGEHLRSATPTWDNVGSPAVSFTMHPIGGTLLGRLTSRHQPDKTRDLFYRMAIIMDGEIISAPRLLSTIERQGQITGNFTPEQVEELAGVLNAGRLPAVLRKDPISENEVSALLGFDTIRSGSIAIAVSLAAVLVFMLVYYRFAGLVACAALVVNLVLIVALMILVKAAFTLPGLAGLVLTVGMSVDANVLIFERIREELRRGAALRMAIRNGFGRATTTIVDANLTTLITASVLYVIGTDQIRGFAVTLWLGILMSMYTAIFCSRVVFDIAERRRWITSLGMGQILGETNWDFLGKRRVAIACSVVLIAAGLFAIMARGKTIFDIDFNGGTSLEVLFNQPMPIRDVRKTVESGDLGDVSVTGVHLARAAVDEDGAATEMKPGEYDVYIINSSVTGEGVPREGDPATFTPPGETDPIDVVVASIDSEQETADLKAVIGDKTFSNIPWDKFQRDGVKIVQAEVKQLFPTQLAMRSMKVVKMTDLLAAAETGTPPAPSNKDANGATDNGQGAADEDASNATSSLTNGGQFSFTAFQAEDADAPADDAPTGDIPADDAPTDDAPSADGSATTSDDAIAGDQPPTDAAGNPLPLAGRTKVELEFGNGMSAESVRALISGGVKKVFGEMDLPAISLDSANWDGVSGERFKKWTVTIDLAPQATKTLLDHIQADLSDSPVWLSSNKIGGQVAGDMQRKAVGALLASLLGIIGYIWFRFQRVAFGLAAVVALLHDVMITLGAIAASMWLARFMGFLLIEEFKISLPIVAALLTIVGYSLNDTIVVFDRIREVRGKNPDLTADMINTSINQTLGRTLLTSVTTLIVVLILYFMGGQAIRGFAFALIIGVFVGTYSSIFIASPFLLWMMNAGKPQKTVSEKAKATTA